MDLADRLLLRAVGAYETRHGAGPTVRELAADLGIPGDFGHNHLVERLRHELALERVDLCRGRFRLTADGRLALEGRLPAPPQAERLAQPASSSQAS